MLIALNRALTLEIRNLVNDPAIAHADLEGPARKGAVPPTPVTNGQGKLRSDKTRALAAAGRSAPKTQ